MTIASGFVAIAMTLAPGQTGTTPQAAAPPALEISLHLLRGVREDTTATIGGSDQLSGYVWTDLNLCSVGTGDREPGVDRVRWRISGRIVQRNGTAVVVDTEWQRIGASGAPDGARETRQVTIEPGARVTLDEFTPAASSPCLATTARLEAAIVTPGASRMAAGGGGRTGGYGAGGAGAAATGGGFGRSIGGGAGGRGRGTASSGGTGSAAAGSGAGGVGAAAGVSGGGGAGAGAGSSAAGGRGIGAGGSRLSAVAMARMLGSGLSVDRSAMSPEALAASSAVAGGGGRVNLSPMPGAAYDAEVWLVNTPPSGIEEIQKMTVRVTTEGQVFTFPQRTIATARGLASIDVAVMLSPRLMEGGTPVLQVVVARGFSGAANSLGSSMKVILLPAPSDIVSFEMPTSDARGMPPISDDHFSVRIKLTPVGKET